MKVLRTQIVCINARHRSPSIFPWQLAAGLRDYSPEVELPCTILECSLSEPLQRIYERIGAEKADIVVFCCLPYSMQSVGALSEALRRDRPAVHQLLAGPEVSDRPCDILQLYKSVDAVLCGDAEYPLACAVAAYCEDTTPAGLPGVCLREPEGISVSPPFYLGDCMPPNPYSQEYLAALDGRDAQIEFGRRYRDVNGVYLEGCGKSHSTGYAAYLMNDLRATVLRLANSGTHRIIFTDDAININVERAWRLLQFLSENHGTKIPADVRFVFRMRPDLLDATTMAVLADAPPGMFDITFLQPTFNPVVAKDVCGQSNLGAVMQAVHDVVSFGNSRVTLELVAGLPGSTLEQNLADFTAAYALGVHRIRMFTVQYDGAQSVRLEENPYFSHCLVSRDLCRDLQPIQVLNSEMTKLALMMHAVQYVYNTGRFRGTADYLIRSCGIAATAFFRAVAAQLSSGSPSPDTVTDIIWELYAGHRCVSAGRLRDSLLCDRLRTSPSLPVPEYLDFNPQERLRLEKLADSDRRFRRLPETPRGAALMSDGVLAYADQHCPDPVTGMYDLHFFSARSLERKHRYVLFDLDGTITDPRVGIVNSVRYALHRQHIKEPNEGKLLRFIGPPLKDSFREFYGMDEKKAEAALRAYRNFYSKTGIFQCKLYRGIDVLLRRMRRAGYRVVLATSKPEMYARELLRYYGITDCFTTIAGSDMKEKRANKADVIRCALKREGITDLNDAVMVGDRRFDIEGGRECGLYTIGVTYGYGTEQELIEADADRILHSVKELQELFL